MWRTTKTKSSQETNSSKFQSTSPVWRTTHDVSQWNGAIRHFNPRPPCGGRQTKESINCADVQFQSTSPVWRTTENSFRRESLLRYFNPRPPCGGRRSAVVVTFDDNDFNPCPPCGGRPLSLLLWQMHLRISIHVPRVEDDFCCFPFLLPLKLFQSTSPVWRTTIDAFDDYSNKTISIHVPRVEDDCTS